MLDRGAHGIRASMAACESLSSSSLRGYGAAEAEGVGVFAEGGDAEGDVLFEGDAQLFGAFADVFLRVAFLAKNLGTFGGVLLVRGVGFVGPALVVEVMEQRGDSPELLIGGVLAGIGADASFHRQHVLAEALGLGVFAQKLPGVLSCGHGL